MHYFLTGGTGFIGSYVAARLLAAGHTVTALVRTQEAAQALSEYGVRSHIGNVVVKDTMRRGMKGVDGVFHVAGWYEVGSTDKKRAYDVNVRGTRNVIELVDELRIPRVVVTSTVAVFGDTNGRVVDERYRFDGRHKSLYDWSKWKAHYDVALPMARAGVPVVIVQPGIVYGPGDTSGMGRLLARYVMGKAPFVPGKLAAGWAHVDDTAAAHLLAMERGEVGESYIVAGPLHRAVEVFGIAGANVGKRPPFPIPAFPLRLGAAVTNTLGSLIRPLRRVGESLAVSTSTYLADSSKAEQQLGWRPRSVEDGMTDTVRAILQEHFEG